MSTFYWVPSPGAACLSVDSHKSDALEQRAAQRFFVQPPLSAGANCALSAGANCRNSTSANLLCIVPGVRWQANVFG